MKYNDDQSTRIGAVDTSFDVASFNAALMSPEVEPRDYWLEDNGHLPEYDVYADLKAEGLMGGPTDLKPKADLKPKTAMLGDLPWNYETANDETSSQVIVLSDGSRLPCGTPSLLGSSGRDIADALLWNLTLEGPVALRHGSFVQYRDGAWHEMSMNLVRAKLMGMHGTEIDQDHDPEKPPAVLVMNSRRSSDALACAQDILGHASDRFFGDDDVSPWRAFRNVSVRLNRETKEIEVEAHDPAHRAEMSFDFDWNTDKGVNLADQCPVWYDSVQQWMAPAPERNPDLDDDARATERRKKVDALMYWIGASLLMGNRFVRRALVLIGPPGSGKSTCIETISKLWPTSRYTAFDINSLNQNYAKADLAGKHLAVCAEATHLDQHDVSALKSIITGSDYIKDRKPYARDFITFKSTASIIIGANQWPSLPDYSGAMFQRLFPLRVEHTFRHTKNENRELHVELGRELGYIAQWAMTIAARHIKDGYEPMPETAADEIKNAWEQSDPVRAWLNEERIDPKTENDYERVSASNLYAEFRNWNEGNSPGSRVLGQRKFVAAIRSHFGEPKKSMGLMLYRVPRRAR